MNSKVLAELAINRGTILHGSFEGISHSKFFVIIGENDKQLVGFFFINSEINQSIKNKQEQFDMQMYIKRADYNFLDHDSFIGADKIKTINKDKIISDIAAKNIQIKGALTDEDLDILLETVRGSKLFSKIEKDTFFK